MCPLLEDLETDYNSFDEDYEPTTLFDCSTFKKVCEACNNNESQIQERILDGFNTPNFNTVVTYNVPLCNSFVNNTIKPILDDALQKFNCPDSIRETIVGSVEAKRVSLGTWDKTGGKKIVGCPTGIHSAHGSIACLLVM
eukprot:8761628-Ditylum_brightwellii.AAC.1